MESLLKLVFIPFLHVM